MIFGKLGAFIVKHKVETLIIGGTVSLVGGTVAAAIGTKKFMAKAEKNSQRASEINDEITDSENSEELTKELDTLKKDIIISAVKYYAPAAAATIGGITAIVCGLISGRTLVAGLSATIAGDTALIARLKEYIVEHNGEDGWMEAAYGAKTETIVDEETGEVTEKTTFDADKLGPFSKFFDNCSGEWQEYIDENGNRTGVGNTDYNLIFLTQARDAFQRDLDSKGIVLLSSVLERLDIPVTASSLTAGWIKGDEIDFGIMNPNEAANRRFVNGYEDAILLVFNCRPDITSDL